MKQSVQMCLAVFMLVFSVIVKADENSDLAKAAALNAASLFKSSFTVKMSSAEIGALVSSAVSAKAAQMGVPLSIKVKYFVLKCVNGDLACSVILDVPEQQRDMMEPQANQLLAGTGFSKALASLSLGALKSAASALENNGDSLALSANYEQVAQFTLNAPGDALFGKLGISKVSVNIGKQYKILLGLRFDFSDGSAAYMQYSYDKMDERIVPVKMQIKHNLKQPVGGVQLPAQIIMVFSEYNFD